MFQSIRVKLTWHSSATQLQSAVRSGKASAGREDMDSLAGYTAGRNNQIKSNNFYYDHFKSYTKANRWFLYIVMSELS